MMFHPRIKNREAQNVVVVSSRPTLARYMLYLGNVPPVLALRNDTGPTSVADRPPYIDGRSAKDVSISVPSLCEGPLLVQQWKYSAIQIMTFYLISIIRHVSMHGQFCKQPDQNIVVEITHLKTLSRSVISPRVVHFSTKLSKREKDV